MEKGGIFQSFYTMRIGNLSSSRPAWEKEKYPFSPVFCQCVMTSGRTVTYWHISLRLVFLKLAFVGSRIGCVGGKWEKQEDLQYSSLHNYMKFDQVFSPFLHCDSRHWSSQMVRLWLMIQWCVQLWARYALSMAHSRFWSWFHERLRQVLCRMRDNTAWETETTTCCIVNRYLVCTTWTCFWDKSNGAMSSPCYHSLPILVTMH